MAYVYRHIRLDKNEPFYIGVSLKNDNFKRAYDKRGRNHIWEGIVSRTDYNVEIIIDNVSQQEAFKKETEFILLYKRIIEGGILCNLTLGGEGQLGMIPWNFDKETPQETKEKQRNKKLGLPSKMRGIPRPQHVIDAVIKACTGRPAWNKGITPRKETIEKRKETMLIVGYKKGENHPMYGKTHSDELKERWRITRKGVMPWNVGISIEVPHLKAIQEQRRISVLQYDLDGNFITSYDSINDAESKSGAGKGNISLCCQGKRKSAGGYKWTFK